jgi:hypothetical protein
VFWLPEVSAVAARRAGPTSLVCAPSSASGSRTRVNSGPAAAAASGFGRRMSRVFSSSSSGMVWVGCWFVKKAVSAF